MSSGLGYSVFVSQFEQVKDRLRALYAEGGRVFTSLHVAEEFGAEYAERATTMCGFLNDLGYSIIADVSRRTLSAFGETDIVALAERLGIHALRLDYGFDEEEVAAIARRMPVCINASTTDPEAAARAAETAVRLYGMHNYYPRPETGLDRELFDALNRRFAEADVEVLSFIPGDSVLRGPLHRGLPTLESHRDAAPYAAFVDTLRSPDVRGVFVGDGVIGDYEVERIRAFSETGVVDVPVKFEDGHGGLYGRTFTVRPDSPRWTLRLAESREYATAGASVEPRAAAARPAGCVTMDNRKYLRYSGEIQILKEDLPADEKVNVIGRVPSRYRLLLGCCPNRRKIRFVEAPDAA